MTEIKLTPIGYVKNDRLEITDDFWGNVISEIKLNIDLFDQSALVNIDMFSHVHVIFYFDRVSDEKIRKGARHPRNNQNHPSMGIFAQRTKNRLNKIGLTRCKIIRLEGESLFVQGLDAINNSPVLDIKPVMYEFDFIKRSSIIQPSWVSEIMKDYFK
jgi:tRNA-Thr(GGU) m(6)t(6)A37 methyltransferase TsaA